MKDGDIVSIDCGVKKNGYFGDSAYTFPVGEVKKEILMLMKRTLESLYKAIDVAIGGNRIGDIGFAIQEYVEGFGYSVVRDLVGHVLMQEQPKRIKHSIAILEAQELTLCRSQ